MEINRAIRLANELINQTYNVNGRDINISNIGYKLDISDTKRACGQCCYTKKLIRLSKTYISLNEEELVKNTILHEIAHAISYHVYGERGHGKTWRFVCIKIGAKPERLNTGAVSATGKYILRHKETKEVFCHYHRKPSSLMKRIGRAWIKGQKQQTFGKLELVENIS